jgi:hypothetical protein
MEKKKNILSKTMLEPAKTLFEHAFHVVIRQIVLSDRTCFFIT